MGLTAILAASELAAGLHGDMLTHPGLVARAAVPVAEGERGRLAIEAQALGYWHPGLMTAMQLRAGPAYRRTGSRGSTVGAFAHVGAAHGFWTAPTYDVVDGGVERARLAGDSWAVGAVGLELGHGTALAGLSGWQVRPQVGVRWPTFHGVGLDAGVELSVRFGGGR